MNMIQTPIASLARVIAPAVASVLISTAVASADTVLYSNGFETDTAGWTGATRVASGTGGITSANGSFHAETGTGTPYTTWGGYNYGAGNAVPTAFREYTTSLAIYLDMDGGAANDTRFAYTSAINNSAGTHNRDFVFSAGFYDDNNAGNRFIVSASNNSPGWPGDPNRSPVTITTTGWYTFAHHFYDNGGVLAVDMTILDAMNNSVATWTLSDPTDLIGGIGGNRYGWFSYNQFSNIAIDDAMLTVVPIPPAVWAGLPALVGVAGIATIRRRRQHN